MSADKVWGDYPVYHKQPIRVRSTCKADKEVKE